MTLFLIVAPSGAGKTSIMKEVHKQLSMINTKYMREAISYTTREKREDEVDGRDYFFVTKEIFKDMISRNEFAEHVEYDNNYYGITKFELEQNVDAYEHIFAIVETHGFREIKRQYKNAVGIALKMSKENCVINMLSRGDSFEKASSRTDSFGYEMNEINSLYCDYTIKNIKDKKSHVVSIVKQIIQMHDENQKGSTVWRG